MLHPIFTDTEAETSIELDGTLNQLNGQLETINATKSVFNITLEDLQIGPECDDGVKDYESQLKKEINDWNIVWRKTLKQVKECETKHPTIDYTLLPPEKRAYLDVAHNLQMFLRDSVEFRQKAHLFLEKDYAEIADIQENLLAVSSYLVGVSKENKIKKNLANTNC